MDQLQHKSNSSKGAIIYLADPMCSWCYGFREEVTRLKEHYATQFDFYLIMGGLRPGGGDPWNQKMKDFLRHHWEQVEKASGQAFKYDLFEREHFHYDTEPACRAVRIVRDLAPSQELPFFKAVQYRFYYENEDPGEIAFYQPICEEMGIDFSSFSHLFPTEQYKALTRQDFEQAMQWGIRGFPSIVIRWKEKLGCLTQGFARFDDMEKRMELLLNKLSL
ncbi:MAG: DsbA family protein [Saprospiraceae bacterium]